MDTQKTFRYGKDRLTCGKALAIARGRMQGIIDQEAARKIFRSRKIVKDIISGDTAVYGINTGFGPLCSTRISNEDTTLLQHNILKSHSVGVGNPIDSILTKLMLITKVHALAFGYSGVSLETLERLIWHIDNDIIPLVPKQGSVGASGDLAPLAHLFLPLIGHGKVFFEGKLINTKELFAAKALKPITLRAKEGLALINGTQFIAAHAVLAVERMHNCLTHSDLIGAMMIESLLGSRAPFHPDLHKLRPYKGNLHVAHRINHLLFGSQIVDSHIDCGKVQDPYSLRCIPQVHGASRTAWLHLKETTEIELNSVTDNPVLFEVDHTISGGNFHGQPLAMPLDYASLATSEIGNISDRRIYLSLSGQTKGVPKLLMKETGVNSAFMMLQYTSAALASENKSLCFPASADSIPTSLGQEDHVSMGSISGRRLNEIASNVEQILSIELLCASQALDYHNPLKSSPSLSLIHEIVRSKISHAEEDRIFHQDIESAHEIIKSAELFEALVANDEYPVTPLDDLFETF